MSQSLLLQQHSTFCLLLPDGRKFAHERSVFDCKKALCYSVQCQFCTLGQASLDVSTACEPCINGQYQENQETKTYGCKSCTFGQSTVDNKQTCKMCDQGKRQTVSNVYSDIACTDCPLGTTSDNSGIACDVCPSAKYSSVAGSLECKSCDKDKNEYTDEPTKPCKVCGALERGHAG